MIRYYRMFSSFSFQLDSNFDFFYFLWILFPLLGKKRKKNPRIFGVEIFLQIEGILVVNQQARTSLNISGRSCANNAELFYQGTL